jgi:hypothetical protein
MLIQKKEFIFAVTVISAILAAVLYEKVKQYLDGEEV